MLLGKTKEKMEKELIKKTNSESLTFLNNGLFDAQINFVFKKSMMEGGATPFLIEKESFVLAPNETEVVRVFAFPEELGL